MHVRQPGLNVTTASLTNLLFRICAFIPIRIQAKKKIMYMYNSFEIQFRLFPIGARIGRSRRD
jgi:hypothetical protein